MNDANVKPYSKKLQRAIDAAIIGKAGPVLGPNEALELGMKIIPVRFTIKSFQPHPIGPIRKGENE